MIQELLAACDLHEHYRRENGARKNVPPLAVSTKIQHAITSTRKPQGTQQGQYILCTDESIAKLQEKGYIEFYKEMEWKTEKLQPNLSQGESCTTLVNLRFCFFIGLRGKQI